MRQGERDGEEAVDGDGGDDPPACRRGGGRLPAPQEPARSPPLRVIIGKPRSTMARRRSRWKPVCYDGRGGGTKVSFSRGQEAMAGRWG